MYVKERTFREFPMTLFDMDSRELEFSCSTYAKSLWCLAMSSGSSLVSLNVELLCATDSTFTIPSPSLNTKICLPPPVGLPPGLLLLGATIFKKPSFDSALVIIFLIKSSDVSLRQRRNSDLACSQYVALLPCGAQASLAYLSISRYSPSTWVR